MTAARKVLLVEVDAEARAAIEEGLAEAGLVVQVCSPDEVDEQTISPALCLVMATASEAGLAAVERLGRRALDGLPVLALVDRDDMPAMERSAAAGVDDFLTRPIVQAELRARVQSQLRLRGYVEELGAEKQDAQVMLELTQALASSLDYREILYTVVRRIADVVHIERVSIVLAPEQDQGDVGYVVVASDDQQLSNLRLDLNKYPEIQQVLRTCQPLTINDVSTHPVLDGVRAKVQQTKLSAMSLFPIVWEDQAIGVLFLRAQSERGSLSDREVHFCQIVANATAVALRNARVMQSLRDHTQQITFARFEAERRLRGLKRYADLFASAAEGIAVIDSEGCLLFANPRAYEIVGHDEARVRGRKVKELLVEDDHAQAGAIWLGFAEEKYPRGVDFRVGRDDGESIVISASFAALHDGEGAVLISFQDVTEQRRTEAELVKTMEFLESLIDASVDGIIASDMDGDIILFNQAAERIYSITAEEVVGRENVRDLYPDDGAAMVMRLIRAETNGGAGRLEPIRMTALGKGGEHIPIQLSAAMIYDHGEAVATFGIFTDLREKLRVEERLAEATQRLASTEKQALIAELAGTAAHELNQPLTSVMAYAELLKRKLAGDTPEARAAEVMVREAERMADIVRKIGKMTKYETKSYVGEQKILDLDKASDGTDGGEV